MVIIGEKLEQLNLLNQGHMIKLKIKVDDYLGQEDGQQEEKKLIQMKLWIQHK